MTTYYETLFAAVDAAVKENFKRFVPTSMEWEDWGFQPMSYEHGQTRDIPGINSKGKECSLHVYVYRMPSGRYEVTAYVTR